MSQPRLQFATDPTTDQARRNLLQKLKHNKKNSQLAELAGELLAGKITPQSVLKSDLYGEALAPVTEELESWYSNLSDKEKDEQATRGEDALQKLAADSEPKPKPAIRAKRAPADDEYEDFSDRSWLDG